MILQLDLSLLYYIAIIANNPEILNQFYEVLLYKKKNIIAIQKKLGISNNANQMANIEARRRKTLTDSYKLLLNLVDIIFIWLNYNLFLNLVKIN
jgi:hypothetical protein